MSFAQQLADAIAGARTFRQFDAASRAIWSAHAACLIDDAAAQAAAEALQARKQLAAGQTIPKPLSRTHSLPRASAPRSPDRDRSIRRRRSVAMSGAVPSRIAAAFTMGELAVLSIVAGEVRRSGDCRLPIDALAALAGTSRSVAKRALREAQRLGLVSVEQRPRPGRKNLTNVVRIVSRDWRAWLRLGGRGPKPDYHVNQSITGKAKKSSQTRSRFVLYSPQARNESSGVASPNSSTCEGIRA